MAAVKTDDKLPEAFTIVKTGMGAGKRSYERPSILRAMLIRGEESRKDTICKLETNIDDCTGEMLGYVMDLSLIHISEPTRLGMISYAVFCLKKKKQMKKNKKKCGLWTEYQ